VRVRPGWTALAGATSGLEEGVVDGAHFRRGRIAATVARCGATLLLSGADDDTLHGLAIQLAVVVDLHGLDSMRHIEED